VPIDSEVGEKIENVKSVTVPVNGGMDIRDKGLESSCRFQFAHLHTRASLKQRAVVGKSEVDNLSSTDDGSFTGGTHEEEILVHRVYVPDDVITRNEAGKEVVQAVQSCTEICVDPRHRVSFQTMNPEDTPQNRRDMGFSSSLLNPHALAASWGTVLKYQIFRKNYGLSAFAINLRQGYG